MDRGSPKELKPIVLQDNMKAVIMSRDIPQILVEWTQGNCSEARVVQLTSEFDIKIPRYLRSEHATFQDFCKFLETRVVPRNRVDIDEVLKDYGLVFYDPMSMCFQSYGRSPTDFIWIDFNDSGYCWKDVCIKYTAGGYRDC